MSNDNNVKSPYNILGIQRSATLAQIKTKYFELARIHHPDKLDPSISETEKKKHEDKFKEITNAYSKVVKDKEFFAKFGTYEIHDDDNNSFDIGEDWRSVWTDIETFLNKPDSWEKMKNIVTDTIKETLYEATLHSIYQSTHKWKETSVPQKPPKKEHYINVEVTLEEVHLKKQKKLRLFLKGIKLPVFLTLDIGEYPETVVEHTITDMNNNTKTVVINFTMELLTHSLYRLDDLLESWDLWLLEPVKITWADYLCGKTLSIPYIDGMKTDAKNDSKTDAKTDTKNYAKTDNNNTNNTGTLNVFIEPFTVHSPYCVKNKGLCGLGNLYFTIEIEPPNSINKSKWDKLDHKFKNCFLRELYDLYTE